MAKQNGFLNVEGTIGDITFVKTQDGYLVKRKSSIAASRIASDPAFQRTRENGAEFGRAGKAVKVLRAAFGPQVQLVKDRRMVSRLQKQMMRVIQADKVSKRGMRNVIDGEATLLQGFEFNGNAQLGATLIAPYSCSIDRATGELTVNIPAFIPTDVIVPPAGATHYKLRSAGGSVDFETGAFVTDASETPRLPIDENATAAIPLTTQVPANSTHPLFLLLGIEFIQEVNGTYYPLKNGAFNAMAIVLVDAGV